MLKMSASLSSYCGKLILDNLFDFRAPPHHRHSIAVPLETKARFKHRTLHVPNLMQMRKIYCFRSFALDSAHEKFDV